MPKAKAKTKSPAQDPPTDLWSSPGSVVRVKSTHPYAGQCCTITARPSPDGAVVELKSGDREYIPLNQLQPLCAHQFSPVWTSARTLIERCSCGTTRPPTLPTLQTTLKQCIAARNEYIALASTPSGQEQQNLWESVQTKEQQIKWLKEQLEVNRKNVPMGTSLGCEVLPPVTALMSKIEALQHIEEINTACNRIRLLLFELEARQGYAALGFKNMSHLMQSGLFAKARSTLQKELQAGRIENNYLNVPVGTFPERYFRPLSKLKPEYYKKAFSEAAQIAGDHSVTEKDVSVAVATMLQASLDCARTGIVERLKQRNITELSISYKEGDVVIICATGNPDLRKHDRHWAIVESVDNYTVLISLPDPVTTQEGQVVAEKYRVHPQFIEETDSSYWQDIKKVYQRIFELQKCKLDPADDAVLEVLKQRLWFTDRQKCLLQRMEEDYELVP